MAGISPALPLTSTTTDGHFKLNKTIEQVTRQNLKNLLLTCPGERIMDPEFGVGMRNFLFEQNTPFTYGEIYTKIVEQTSIYMNYIQINDIVFNDGETSQSQFDTNTVSITIHFTILPLNLTDILTLPI
tara:strand:- start:64 stop:450 length:387 start_codon:yes stop_codon:yes gene_type:complete